MGFSRDPYFLGLQSALQSAGIGTPVLVIDKTRLNKNIDTMMDMLPDGVSHRLPAKSLPSGPLISYVQQRTGSRRLMTFNLQMLLELSETSPDADQLLGRPLPAAAMKAYFDALPVQLRGAAEKVQWLVDSPARLEQYSSIAAAQDMPLRINVEIDVGLHRGGITPGPDLKNLLEAIKADSNLVFAGFMGYEPHIAAMPKMLNMRAKAEREAHEKYRTALSLATAIFGETAYPAWTRNAAGSPTFRLYQDDAITNDITVGSALVKPTDFDKELLTDFVPACFIAAPVLKELGKTTLPGPDVISKVSRALNPKAARTVFLAGGKWMANMADPRGLVINNTFGRSTNQEMWNGPADLDLKPDDFVFLRPTQSEVVFLQFGALTIFEDGQITDTWSVFSASA